MDREPESILDVALVPLRVVVSRPAQRAYLTTALSVIASIFLYIIAVFAYSLFYFNYIPQIGLERVVHLQFGDGHPQGITSLGDGLVSQQPYDVFVNLDLPRSPPNLEAGNFMLDLSLATAAPASGQVIDEDRDVLTRSRRPAILTYESPLVNYIKTSSRALWLVFGWRREAETLEVQMMEGVEFSRGWRTVPKYLRLEVQADEKLQIYKALVTFKTRFYGIRWIMYNHRIFSLVFFSTIFWLTELVFTAMVWVVFSSYLAANPTTPIKSEPEGTPTTIKAESAEDDVDPDSRFASDLSDTSRTFPTTSRQPPLRYTRIKREDDDGIDLSGMSPSAAIQPLSAAVGEADDEDEDDGLVDIGASTGGRADSGLGTSMEEGSGRATVQRRRSRGKGSTG